jgi:hypothetical protein
METLNRVPEPRTLILREEIIRNIKCEDLFTRALAGDLGEKAKVQRMHFVTKHPLAFAMTPLIRNMVPLQGSYERLMPAETNRPGLTAWFQKQSCVLHPHSHQFLTALVGQL